MFCNCIHDGVCRYVDSILDSFRKIAPTRFGDDSERWSSISEFVTSKCRNYIAIDGKINVSITPSAWVDVKKRLPEPGVTVIVPFGIARIREDGVWYTGMEEPIFTRPITWPVTHWQPFPELKP